MNPIELAKSIGIDEEKMRLYLSMRTNHFKQLRTMATNQVAKDIKKANKKTAKAHPKGVKEYLESSKAYNDSLKLAIKCRKYSDMFAPEAVQFIRNRHNKTRKLMIELEANKGG